MTEKERAINEIRAAVNDIKKAEAEVNKQLNDILDMIDSDDGLLPTPNPLLTKAKAAVVLDALAAQYADTNDLPEPDIDWRGIIDENIRSANPPSTIKTGKTRGNCNKWGSIPHHRSPRGKNCRVLFSESQLMDWFINHGYKALHDTLSKAA